MKILIVDDHPLFLLGLRQILIDHPTSIEALEAHDHAQAFELLRAHADIEWICLDLQMPGADGFSFLQGLERLGIKTPVAILSANEDPVVVHRALQAGAAAYLSKSMAKAELVEAFSAIQRSGRYVSKILRQPLADHERRLSSGETRDFNLTRRQREVLRLLAHGASNQSIAATLNIAESTVKGHVSTLFDLLQVDNRAGCTSAAIRLGLVE